MVDGVSGSWKMECVGSSDRFRFTNLINSIHPISPIDPMSSVRLVNPINP